MALDGLGWELGSVPTISKLKVIMRSGGFFRPLRNIWNRQSRRLEWPGLNSPHHLRLPWWQMAAEY